MINKKKILLISLVFLLILLSSGMLINKVKANGTLVQYSSSGDFKVTVLNTPPLIATTGDSISITLKLEYRGYPVINLSTSTPNDLPALIINDKGGKYITHQYFTEQGYGIYVLQFNYQTAEYYKLQIDTLYTEKGETLSFGLGSIYIFWYPWGSVDSFVLLMIYLIIIMAIAFFVSRYIKNYADDKQIDNERLLQISGGIKKGCYGIGMFLPLLFFSFFFAGVQSLIMGAVIISICLIAYWKVPPKRSVIQHGYFEPLWIGWILGSFLFYYVGLNIDMSNFYFQFMLGWQIYFWSIPVTQILLIARIIVQFRSMGKTAADTARRI